MSLDKSPKNIRLRDIDQIKSSRSDENPEIQRRFIKGLGKQPRPNIKIQALTLDRVEEHYPKIKGLFDAPNNPLDPKGKAVAPKDIKVLVFPAIGTDGRWDHCRDGTYESFPVFFINFNDENLITTIGIRGHGTRHKYFDIVAGSSDHQIVEDDYVIAGHQLDNLIFKIPWEKKIWGDGLPASTDVNGFNKLYGEIKKQQNQMTTVSNHQTPTNNQPQRITLNCNIDGKKRNITLAAKSTVGDLVQYIKQKTGGAKIQVIHNALELKEGDARTLMKAGIQPGASLTVNTINQITPSSNPTLLRNETVNNLGVFNAPNNNQTQQSHTITLRCVNSAESGLKNYKIRLFNFEIEKGQTIGDLKERILTTKGDNVYQAFLQGLEIQKDDFAVCKVNPKGEPTDILDDSAKISTAFSDDTRYVIIPKKVKVDINIDKVKREYKYPVIINNNQFNKETLLGFISTKLREENRTVFSTDLEDNMCKEKGWEVAAGCTNCFSGFQYKDTTITTNPIITKPVQVPVPQPKTTTNINSNTNRSGAIIYGENGYHGPSIYFPNQSGSNTISSYNTQFNPFEGKETVANTKHLNDNQLQQMLYAPRNQTKNQSPYPTQIIHRDNPYQKTYYHMASLYDSWPKRKRSSVTYIHPQKMYNTAINQNLPNNQNPQAISSISKTGTVYQSKNPSQINPFNQGINSAKQSQNQTFESVTIQSSVMVPNIAIKDIQNYKPNATFSPPQLGSKQNINDLNNHFVSNYDIWKDGKKQVLTNVPVQQVQTVPVPAKPPVGPVPPAVTQGHWNQQPQRSTYYAYGTQGGQCGWIDQKTLQIPTDYQTFINNHIYTSPTPQLNDNFIPKYQYCDELGLIFESDRPIYKDVKGNLVTLGNGRYRTP